MTDDARPAKIDVTAQILMIAVRILSTRALTLLGLLFDAGFFAWAAGTASWMRLITAVIFSVVAWAVVNLQPPGKEPAP